MILSNYWKLLGIEVKDVVRPGHVKLTMNVTNDLLQASGSVMHGGAAASLIDSASWAAISSLNSPSDKWATTELKVNYLAAVMPGDELEAESRVIHNGKTLAVSTTEVRNLKRKLVCIGVATFILIKKNTNKS